jgi:hypothetical protein
MEIQDTRPPISQNWLSRFRRRLGISRRQFPERTVIHSDDTELTVTDYFPHGATRAFKANWNEINAAVEYKRDCFAYDLLCIAFSTPDGSFEANEHMEGWKSLLEILPTYLPGTPKSEEWWLKVVQPPFATNATILFSREAEAVKSDQPPV